MGSSTFGAGVVDGVLDELVEAPTLELASGPLAGVSTGLGICGAVVVLPALAPPKENPPDDGCFSSFEEVLL